jgi:hypothetical protein
MSVAPETITPEAASMPKSHLGITVPRSWGMPKRRVISGRSVHVMPVMVMPSGAKIRSPALLVAHRGPQRRHGRCCAQLPQGNVMVGTPQSARHHPGEPPAAG